MIVKTILKETTAKYVSLEVMATLPQVVVILVTAMTMETRS